MRLIDVMTTDVNRGRLAKRSDSASVPEDRPGQMPEFESEEWPKGLDLPTNTGARLNPEQFGDQDEAAGWLPVVVANHWPSAETHRAISSRRRDLYDAMRRLEESAARPNGQTGWIESVRGAVAGLESALDRHQRETEAPDGLFAEVVDRSPNLLPAVDSLCGEHREMLSKCQAIRDLVAVDVSPFELRRKVVGLLGRLVLHRQNGAELIFDAYNVDLGTSG